MELMVALVIGSMLTLGVIQIFLSTRLTYSVTEQLSRLQENARFAMSTLSRDIRMAGYVGCSDLAERLENQLNDGDDPTELFSMLRPLEAVEAATGSWRPSGSTDSVAEMLPNTDAITVRHIGASGAGVVSMAAPAGELVVAGGQAPVSGDIVAVSDCRSTDVFQVTGTSPVAPTGTSLAHVAGTAGTAPGNERNTLSKAYASDATATRVVARRYFVGAGDNGPALFQEAVRLDPSDGEFKPLAVELVEGIENLQITYGEDIGSDRVADVNREADDVVDWDNVVSVQIGLLVRTVDEEGPDVDTRTYDVNGTTVDPVDDRRRRRVYQATIFMRNLQ